MDRWNCVQTKASPCALDLSALKLPCCRDASLQADAAMQALPLQPIAPLTDGKTPISEATKVGDDRSHHSTSPSGSRDSPKKRQLVAVKAARNEAVTADPITDRPTMKAIKPTGKVLLEPVAEEKLSPCARGLEDAKDAKDITSQTSTFQSVSTLLQHVGVSASENPWQSKTVYDETSPRRYMPSEPLPNYTGWGRKKKSKSKSPGKKQRDFAKNYW